MSTGKIINNPAGVWGEAVQVDQDVVMMTNNSGGTLAPGDVVTLDLTAMTSYGGLVKTTTTASDPQVFGVVSEPNSGLLGTASSGNAYASGAVMPVVVKGPARVNIAANTVAAGAALATSTAAKVAAVPATAGSVAALQALVGSFIAIAGEAQTAKDANNTIRCYVTKM